MFLHFNLDKGVACNDCGNSSTIMHMSMEHLDRSVHLCTACFWTLARTVGHASKKITPAPFDTEIFGLSRPPNSTHRITRMR